MKTFKRLHEELSKNPKYAKEYKKEMTMKEYSKKMDEIIEGNEDVADKLNSMLTFAGGVEIIK